MKRFVYAPDVQAFIGSEQHGIIDVSADIISGSVNRSVNAVSTASLELQNPYRKYEHKFKPMDKLVVYLTRIKPMLVFSGYLDSTTLEQLYPGPVRVTASCTLKRLLHTHWDPALPYVQHFFTQHGWTWDVLTGNIFDNKGRNLWNLDRHGSLGEMLRVVLNEVGTWPIGVRGERKNTVHVLQLPQRFLEKTERLITEEIAASEEQRRVVETILRELLTVEGVFSDPFQQEELSYEFSSKQVDDTPLLGSLAGEYKASIYGPNYMAFGWTGAFRKELERIGISVNAEQLQNIQTIYSVAKQKGFNDKAAIGWVAAAYPESTWTNGATNDSSGASGLFQLLSSGFYGSDGILAKAIREVKPGYSGSPVIGGPETRVAQYNVLAIMRPENVVSGTHCTGGGGSVDLGIGSSQEAKDFINDSTIPHQHITDIYIRPSCGEKLANNYPNGDKVFAAGMRALDASDKPNETAKEHMRGNVGDVRVGNTRFFKQSNPRHPEEGVKGMTFRIKGNPYGDDEMIFRAVKYDPSRLRPNEIEIYVPGAADDSTPQAQSWVDGVVVLESSINKQKRFEQTTAKSKPAEIDVSKMTVRQLTNGGKSLDGLAPITLAALAFIQTNYGPFILTSALRADDIGSDHQWGGAVDLAPCKPDGSLDWTESGIARTDALAKWAGWRANTGGNAQGNPITRWVGWLTESGHGPPGGPMNPDGPHLHISFLKGVGTDQIPEVTGTDTLDAHSRGTSRPVHGSTGVLVGQESLTDMIASVGVGMQLVFPLASNTIEAQNFSGERALFNDQPLMEFVEFITKSSGRHFQSMPNGDFLAFYPDYFNWSQESPYFRISDIETMDLNIELSDDPLTTHVFTTADSYTANGEIDITDRLASTVASIESLDTFRDLVNVTNEFKPTEFLQRYGARPMTKEVPEIKNSFMQFMYGWMTFLEQWAKMFTATPTFTFMPELYPGGLIEFESKGIVMYINSVTHNFDRGSGFTTTAELVAPSSITKKRNYGMILSERSR